MVDALRERRPPFSPEYAKLLRSYPIKKVVGDRHAGEWPRKAFKRLGIRYELANKPKSGLYVDALAALNSERLELVAHPRLIAQLVGLERRTSRAGKDSIDHGPGGHDDLANVVAGLAATLLGGRRPGSERSLLRTR